MIEKDLRIGNLLQWGDGEITVDLNLIRDFNVYYNNGLTPLPITEELLIRCGFKKTSEDDEWIDYWWDGITITVLQSTPKMFAFVRSVGDKIYLRYFHILQNLIYALYEKEIQIITI